MTFPISFPQYAKSSMDSSTKILRKIKTVSRVMQKSNITSTFYYISNSVFKRNYHDAEFHCLRKRFATKLDRYITTIVFKDERRWKCIMRTNSVFQGLPYIWNTFKYFNTFTPGALRKFLQNCGKRSSLYKAHTELIKAKKSAKNKRNCQTFFRKPFVI